MNDESLYMGDHEQMSITTRLAIIRTIEAEKRTHLAELRTGIGILTIPMSLLTILIATSRYYIFEDVLLFIVGLSFGIIALAFIGAFLVYRALKLMKNDGVLLKQVGLHTHDAVLEYGENQKK
jgi:uncharacterized membrane protein YidH (DUF202 family)